MTNEYRHLVIYDGQQLRKEVDRVAKAQGMSRSRYILLAIKEKLDREDQETTLSLCKKKTPRNLKL